jgi:hypothetical protein
MSTLTRKSVIHPTNTDADNILNIDTAAGPVVRFSSTGSGKIGNQTATGWVGAQGYIGQQGSKVWSASVPTVLVPGEVTLLNLNPASAIVVPGWTDPVYGWFGNQSIANSAGKATVDAVAYLPVGQYVGQRTKLQVAVAPAAAYTLTVKALNALSPSPFVYATAFNATTNSYGQPNSAGTTVAITSGSPPSYSSVVVGFSYQTIVFGSAAAVGDSVTLMWDGFFWEIESIGSTASNHVTAS